MNPSVVLVLGAGASISMGYPIGSALRTALTPTSIERIAQAVIESGSGIDRHDVEAFSRTFRDSQMLSIDSFLARRPDMVDIGKRAIAAVLLTQEQAELLHSCQHDDKWYQYFFNHIATEDWNSLDFSNFAVITFNYDRSLEHYLVSALSASYNRPRELCEQKIASLRIVHVYGSLGPTSPKEPGYFPYGNAATSANIQIAAERLRVIPEGRDEDETLSAARLLLSNADHIAFLGFGFDETNLRRLKSRETCAEMAIRHDGRRHRRVIATCVGMTVGEVHRALRETRGSVPTGNPHDTGFMSLDCLSTLRATQILCGDA
jgi:hypothetical protein